MWLDPEKEIEREEFEKWKTHPLTNLKVLNHVTRIEQENKELKEALKKFNDFFTTFNSLLGNTDGQYYDSREQHCQEILEKTR